MKITNTVTISRVELNTIVNAVNTNLDIAGDYCPSDILNKIKKATEKQLEALEGNVTVDVKMKSKLATIGYVMRLKDELTYEVTIDLDDDVLTLMASQVTSLHQYTSPVLKAMVGVWDSFALMNPDYLKTMKQDAKALEEGLTITDVEQSTKVDKN